MMGRLKQDERGIALAVVLFGLIVIGALVAGALFAGRQEERMGENTRRLNQSFSVAEYGLADYLRGWRPDSMNGRGLYPTDSAKIASTTSAGHSGSYGGWVYRLSNSVFLMDVTGRDTMSAAGRVFGSGARQRLGMITRLRPAQIDFQASLTTEGSVKLQGNAAVNGADQVPVNWLSCSAPGAGKAGIRTDGGNVTTGGNAVVTGTPPVNVDTTVNPGTFTQFGDLSYNDLAASATITLPGGNYKTGPAVSDGVCDRTVLTNWGDGQNPTAACGSYLPIIHITGNTVLNGDQGQGILLVDGDLSVQGSYDFFGIVIVQGLLSTAGGGVNPAHFWGGVLAKAADVETISLSGKATLNYSSCAVTQALQATAMPRMLRSRGWVQLY